MTKCENGWKENNRDLTRIYKIGEVGSNKEYSGRLRRLRIEVDFREAYGFEKDQTQI